MCRQLLRMQLEMVCCEQAAEIRDRIKELKKAFGVK